jgi:hypothetical protein
VVPHPGGEEGDHRKGVAPDGQGLVQGVAQVYLAAQAVGRGQEHPGGTPLRRGEGLPDLLPQSAAGPISQRASGTVSPAAVRPWATKSTSPASLSFAA